VLQFFCVFISITWNLLLYFFQGSEILSTELRVRCAIEMGSNRQAYLDHPNAGNLLLLSPFYDKAVQCCAMEGGESCIWVLFGLATVLRRRIISVYPTMYNCAAVQLCNTILSPLHDEQNVDPFHILWTRMTSDGPSPWSPNHFVPMIQIKGMMCVDF